MGCPGGPGDWLAANAINFALVALLCSPAPLLPAGDSNSISVGERTAVQDKVLVHVGPSGPGMNRLPAVIGSKVTIGACPHTAHHDSALILA